MQKIVYLAILLLMVFSLAFQADANDTDLYILTQVMQQVPPDGLILLDLSGSMTDTPAGSSTYTLYIDPGTCTTHGHTTTCTHNCGDTNIAYYTASASPHTTSCSFSSTQTIYGDPACAGPYYYSSGTGHTTNCTQSKVAIAKRAIFNFLDIDNGSGTGIPDGIINSNDQSYLKIRMGYMRYYNCSSSSPEATGYPETNSSSYSSGCNTLIDALNTPYSTIYCNNSTSCTQSSSGSATSVAYESASGGTPLAAALQEVKYYFDYTKSSDVDAACRQKFVILITDGDDTYACGNNGQEGQTIQYKGRRETVAQARALANAGYYVFVVGFGSAMPAYLQNTLNWAAYYGKTKNSDVTQSITQMYTIPYGHIYPSGVTQCMNSSYTNGGTVGGYTYYYANTNDPGQYGISGYAFIAQNESQLDDAIMNIRNFIITLIAQSTSYVAPVVPISQFQSTSSESRMYLGMFKPTITTMWEGNIKKYGIASTNTPTVSVGDVLDVNNQLVLTPENTIKTTAQSYWSASADGGEVEAGGIGALLLARNPDSRNIYTYLGTHTNLTDPSNAFTKSNAAITTTLLGVSSATDKNNVIDFIHGWDAWSWNSGPGTKRSWILGAFIHSRPLVIHYGSYDVIYAGANDGMFHAFKDSNGTTSDDGTELWGFIPPDLLPNLKNFNNSLASLQMFADGSPKAYVTYVYNADGSINSVSQAILIFGERRGGNQYYALDVTNPSAPNFLWSISPSTAGYGELGQSWSTPILGKIKNGTGTKWVAFIGGGYDTNQDNTSPASDAHGRAVYVVDITNGNQIWKYSHSNDSNMIYCIPSDIAALDVNGDGLIERLYVGDTGGQIWRFDIVDMSDTASWSGKIIFTASGKIFYPPDVTLENDSLNYEMLFFGTGDREKPYNTSSVNTLYALKDKNPATPYTESSDLVDVTQDLLQDPNTSTSDKVDLLNQLKQKNGWYIRLSQNSGEKCDAPVVVLAGAAYFTSFTPTPASGGCTLGTGQGRNYILKYKTGNAAFNLDASNDVEGSPVISRTDRSMNIGLGIPSGIIISVIGDTVVGYGGVAGGVFSPDVPITRPIVPTGWRIVF